MRCRSTRMLSQSTRVINADERLLQFRVERIDVVDVKDVPCVADQRRNQQRRDQEKKHRWPVLCDVVHRCSLGKSMRTCTAMKRPAALDCQPRHVVAKQSCAERPTAVHDQNPALFSVRIGGVELLSLSDSISFGYTQYRVDFAALGTSTDLAFTFQHSPAFWDLDNVTASAVPEPATAVLVGLAGLAAFSQTRRRKAA